MASVYKRKCDRHRKSAPYYVAFNDHDGKRRARKGFTDRGLTEQLGARLEHEAMLRRRGLIDPVQEKLAAHKARPVEEPLAAFEKGLAHATPKHVRLTMTRVRRIVEGCGFESIGAIDGESVEQFLIGLRAEEDLGARTYNHYLQAFGEFCKWLVETGRLAVNPVASLDVLNAETDVRHKRRALAPEEVERLMASARSSGEVIQGYDGETRARIYLVSFLTGLRRQEMGSLTPRSFDLGAGQPTVTVEAACSKHRRKDVLPLHPLLVELLPSWMVGLAPDEPLFPRIARRKTWLLVKKDLARIGIPYETAEGVADFHASGRHSYVTGLLRNGASITEARELARHSDVRMTMKYTHIGLEDRARALAALPAPGSRQQRFSSAPGGSAGHASAAADTNGLGEAGSGNDETPSGEGVSSSVVSACQEEAFDVSSGGGGNCTRVPGGRNQFGGNNLRRRVLRSAGYWLGACVTLSRARNGLPSVAETVA
jgi:site-specific recombinase XerC